MKITKEMLENATVEDIILITGELIDKKKVEKVKEKWRKIAEEEPGFRDYEIFWLIEQFGLKKTSKFMKWSKKQTNRWKNRYYSEFYKTSK